MRCATQAMVFVKGVVTTFACSSHRSRERSISEVVASVSHVDGGLVFPLRAASVPVGTSGRRCVILNGRVLDSSLCLDKHVISMYRLADGPGAGLTICRATPPPLILASFPPCVVSSPCVMSSLPLRHEEWLRWPGFRVPVVSRTPRQSVL